MEVWVVLEFNQPNYSECGREFESGLVFETERAAEAYLIGKGYVFTDRKRGDYLGKRGMEATISRAPVMTDQKTERLLLESTIRTDYETKEYVQMVIDWLKKGEKE